jgi:hydroxymethylpyrimidine pyrophosphatase-like HAD family hydrolase
MGATSLNSPVKAVVTDFDGTITTHDGLDDRTRHDLDAARRAGLALVLATGRRWCELDHVLPDGRDLFDAIVCENGAVLDVGGEHVLLHPPVDAELADALRTRGVPATPGEVLIAIPPGWDDQVHAVVAASAGDAQVVRNRGELMVLPAGCSKATGAKRALEHLGLSIHNAVGMGDAENDQSLLDACEWSVVPSTAVAALRRHADRVLDEAPPRAFAELLALLGSDDRPRSRRHRLVLGDDLDDRPVTVAGGDLRMLITGGTHAGKSYLAGAIVEELIAQDHAVVVIDPEGDYDRLGSPLGPCVMHPRTDAVAERVVETIQHRGTSVVVDLSGQTVDDQRRAVRQVASALDEVRTRTGMPQWVVIDEAHLLLTEAHTARQLLGRSALGTCVVSYRPHELDRSILDDVDVAIVVPGAGFDDRAALEAVATLGAVTVPDLERELAHCRLGEGLVLRRGCGTLEVAKLRERRSAHVRHREKYLATPLPTHLHFHFRERDGDEDGFVATDVEQFHHGLRRASVECVRHHIRHHDFSTWFDVALQDPWTAATIHAGEDHHGPEHQGVELARASILATVESRYLR